MQNRNTRRLTERQQVELRPNSAPTIQRNNRFFSGRGNDQAVRDAQALADAFGAATQLGGQIAVERAREYSLKGQKAALEGRELTPEEQRSDSFMRGFQAVLDDRAVIDFESRAVELYESLDARNTTPEQVVEKLNELFASEYQGVDMEDDLDRESMQRIMPRLEEVQEKILAQHKADVGAALQDDIDASVSVAIEHELTTTGSLDLQAWNEKFFQLYGPKQANEELFTAVTSLAIRTGNPALIEELQATKHWESGAAAPGGMSDFNTQIQNALQQARAQERFNEQLNDKADTEADRERTDAIGASVYESVVAGRTGEAESILLEAVTSGEMDAADARTWLNWTKAQEAATVGGVSTSPELYADLSVRVATGNITVDELAEYARNKQLSADDLNRFTATLRTVNREMRNDPVYRSQRQLIESMYTAPREVREVLPAANIELSERLLAYDQARAAGQSHEQALAALPEPTDWEAAFEQANSPSPSDRIDRWRNGISGPEGVLAGKPQDTSMGSYLLDLLEDGAITVDEYNKLKDAGGIE